jgi:hypothetical protein
MEVGIQVELLLDETSKVRAEHTGFVGGGARAIISNIGKFAQSDADSNNLLGEIFHVLADEIVAGRMEEDGETPGVSKGDKVGLAREEVNVEDSEDGDLFAGDGRLVETFFHVWRQ